MMEPVKTTSYRVHGKLRLLWESMEGNRLRYVGALISIGIATLFSYSGPLVLRVTIDSVIGNNPLELPPPLARIVTAVGGTSVLAQALWICSVAFVAITLGNGLFSFLQGRWSAVAAESSAKRIRERVYDHLQHLSYDYHVKAETGDLIQRCTSDIETVRRTMAIQLVEIGRAMFMVGIAVPLMYSLSPWLTGIAMIAIPVIFTFALVFFIRVRSAFARSDAAEGEMSTVLQENLTGVRVVRAFARQRFEVEKFDAKNRNYRDLTYRLIMLLATYWQTSDFLAMGQMGAILIMGTLAAQAGRLTIGTLMVFLTIEGMLLFPIRQLGRVLADMGKTAVSLGRIREILSNEREPMPSDALRPEISGRIDFEHVSFRYGPEREILRDISFRVEPGMTVALLGPTGSGKSSLVHLLPRLYEYTEGSIRLDGVELSTIDRKWVRQHIGFVLQEPFLYAKSIKDNLRMARNAALDEEIFAATQIAAVHDVILAFDRGYDTPVGERGVTLSGGQKQRVAIARALITGSPILVFDDSLSAVDTETDAAIRKALGKRRGRATTFIISHRLNTLASADLILVLERGRIVQAGSHEKLLAVDGLYRRVWEIQNALESELEGQMDQDNEGKEYARIRRAGL